MTDIRIALIGFGNVGQAFFRYTRSLPASAATSFRFAGVADSSGGVYLDDSVQIDDLLKIKESGEGIRSLRNGCKILTVQDFVAQASVNRVSVIVEALPTDLEAGQPALNLLLSGLSQGIPVVTVDKGPLIYGYSDLSKTARDHGIGFGFSGTTGVRSPDMLNGLDVFEITGVLNGTTNHILTSMLERGLSRSQALAEAQALGIAEPNPSFDLEGWDTACKILVLAKAWMGSDAGIQSVSRRGIDREIDPLINRARAEGKVVRLIGRARAWGNRIHLSVEPRILGPDSKFFYVSGASKAAQFSTIQKGDLFTPAQSGRNAISQTILEDILAVCTRPASLPPTGQGSRIPAK